MFDPKWEDIHNSRPWSNVHNITLCKVVEASIPKGGKILDLGCGVGAQAIHLAFQDYHVLGVDGSISALNNLKQSLIVEFPKNLTLVAADVMNLDYPPIFDCVIDAALLLHLPYDMGRELVQRVKRWLTPEGVFVSFNPRSIPEKYTYGQFTNFYTLEHMTEIVKSWRCYELASIDSEIMSKEVLSYWWAQMSHRSLKVSINDYIGKVGRE